MKRRHFCGAALCIGFALLAGCGGGGGGGGNGQPTAPPIVGRWRLTRVQAGALTLNCPGSLTVPGVGSATCTDQEVVQYKADGTFSASGNLSVSGIELPGDGTIPTNASGTYGLAGDQLTINVTQPALPDGQPTTVTARFSNNNRTMTVTTTQDGVTATSTFARL